MVLIKILLSTHCRVGAVLTRFPPDTPWWRVPAWPSPLYTRTAPTRPRRRQTGPQGRWSRWPEGLGTHTHWLHLKLFEKGFLKVWYPLSDAVIGKYFWTTSSVAHKTLKSIKSTFRFSNKSLHYLMCSGLQLEGLYCGPLFTELQSRTFLCIQH